MSIPEPFPSEEPNSISSDSPYGLRPDYRMVFEGLPEGVFTVDIRRRITSFNRTAETITGYTRKEAIGRNCWEIFRSDLCRQDCPLAAAMKNAPVEIDREISTLNRKGEYQPLRVNVNVLRDSGGKILGAVETFRSLTACAEPEAEGPVSKSPVSEMIGRSPAMQTVFSMLPDVAASDAGVLICGESGTGKDVLAQAIHRLSRYRNGPFVAVNCAALAESLLESELFGHEKGAFTGADRAKLGRFELARGGTLFLDEIGEMKPELQVKLLRVIEGRVFERVGGTRPISLQARIISATHQNLTRLLKEGRFREDLYYRLRTIPVTLPPLRERREDIPLLVDNFIKAFNKKYEKTVRTLDPKAMRMFMGYRWPGNIRELERCLEHAFVFVKGPVIFCHHLPEIHEFPSSEPMPLETARHPDDPNSKKAILWALARTGGRKQEAAAILGLSRTSMWRRMKALGLISRASFEE